MHLGGGGGKMTLQNKKNHMTVRHILNHKREIRDVSFKQFYETSKMLLSS